MINDAGQYISSHLINAGRIVTANVLAGKATSLLFCLFKINIKSYKAAFLGIT
ncbi:hypothetical protein SedNR2807_17250 [Citrobacter sedlakii]|uniref:hypothetical protein n=1 Tax=Citrobacter sedlakii TaxID=67826 RepID=UPI00388E3B0A